MINKLRSALAIALIAAAGPAAALGLGQIQVKSRLDQPLLAEIQIISNDPGELEQLQARLASPETFRRVGLEPPSGITADLQFSVALDARGNPVIRVTSSTPVSQPLVSFLVEVEWGQGRLVREYSALLDTPRTVAAPAQPPIQAPIVAPPNTIQQPVIAPPPAVAVTPEPLPEEAPAVAQAPPPPAPPAALEPEPAAAAIADAPDQAPVATQAPSVAEPGNVNVQSGDTLAKIAGALDASRDYTLDQTMLALLRANPEAFIHDNINLLKQGAVLRVPTSGEVAQYSQAEAAAVVRDHVDQWRVLRQPAPQPAAVVSSDRDRAPQATTGSNTARSNARVTEARLAIVPPSNGGNRPGTRSGTSAGGEGEMLRQELQQTKEDLAARASEVNELKTRVAELEQLQQQQQQLISMKDGELAAAQQRLADARKAAPATVAAPAAQTTGKTEPGSATPWLFGGLALIGLGLLAWLFTRRRADKPGQPLRTYDTAALAAGIPTTAARERKDLFAHEPEVTDETLEPATTVAPPPHWAAAPAAASAVPTWHGGAPAAVAEPAAGDASQQLELARAYLDLGDDDAARALLREVLDGRDPAAREAAAKLLREL